MNKTLVTGASGFVGSALCRHLVENSFYIKGLVHTSGNKLPGVEYLPFDLAQPRDMTAILKGVDCVVHLAARAHILNDKNPDALEIFRKINCHASLYLAAQAAHAGVRRFIFMSSIGVNGAFTRDQPFNEGMPPAPHAEYAISKLEAEEGLRKLSRETGMELVIIRSPLVYASDAPGNFGRLLNVVEKGTPLPLGLINNLRSFIARDNLVDFIRLCMQHPHAANQVFMISDGDDISTPQLIRLLAEGMNRPARLFPFPDTLLALGARILGRQSMYQQLCGSLQVDISKARNLLGWQPVVSVKEALRKAGEDFLNNHQNRSRS